MIMIMIMISNEQLWSWLPCNVMLV